jgi:regulator of replication initiation timing
MAAMPWPPRRTSIDTVKLKQENHALQMTLTRLRCELRTKTNYISGLEQVVRQRFNRIDALSEIIDRLRDRNWHLGLENEVLTAMIAAPPVDAAMLAPK